MVNRSKKHTENGLVQEFFDTRSGFKITTNIVTGMFGESGCLIINDRNIYDDKDSRSKRPTEYIIPIEDIDDLKGLCMSIKKALKERKKTLIK